MAWKLGFKESKLYWNFGYLNIIYFGRLLKSIGSGGYLKRDVYCVFIIETVIPKSGFGKIRNGGDV